MFVSSCPLSFLSRIRVGLVIPLCVGLVWISKPAFASEIPFSAPESLGASIGHASLADMDGDGDLDMLGDTGVDIRWWENDGAWTEHLVSPGAFAGSVQAADLDGDGDLDILAAFAFPGEIAWFENTAGDASAWTQHTVASGTRAAVGDFDRDGDLDIGALTSGLVWLENTAGDASAWSSHPVETMEAPRELWIADLDRDGDPDFLGWDDTLAWWQNTADGSSWARVDIETGVDLVSSAALTDMDGDGDYDVLAATFVDTGGSEDQRLGWWENTAGDGSAWTEIHLESSAGSSRLTSADLDGDGDMDFVRAFYFGALDWWENTGSAGAWARHEIDGTFVAREKVLVGDTDQDGDLDLVALDSDDGSFRWQNETPHRNAIYPDERAIDTDFDRALSVAVADFDGDGDNDVAAGSSGGLLAWWENTAGDASAWAEHTVDDDIYEARRLVVADLDGDGDPDLLSGSASTGGLRWWQNNGDGSTFTDRTITDLFPDSVAMRAADLDGDGDMDVIGASTSFGVRWWENSTPLRSGEPEAASAAPERMATTKADGDGSTWIEHTVDGAVEAWSVDLADFDGDGDLDLVAPDYFGDAIHWWQNTAGDGSTWTEHDVVTGVDGPTEVMARDFNGDGHPDVVGVMENDDDMWRWQNDGTGGGWSARIVSINPTRSLDVTDLDGDGDNDVVGPRIDEKLVWWRNAEDGFDWYTNLTTSDFLGAASAVAADLDGDGDPDLVGAATTDDTIAWWPNLGAQAELITDDAVALGTVDGGSENIALLRITARHHGRFGDAAIELSSLALLFEKEDGEPLDDTQLNALVADLHLYRDDGDGSFDAGADTLVHSLAAPFELDSGLLGLAPSDGNPAAQVAFGADDIAYATRHFFVVIDLAESSSGAIPNQLRVRHLVAEDNAQRSMVEMAGTDLALSLALPEDGISSTVTVMHQPEPLFLDGFETGDITLWSESVP